MAQMTAKRRAASGVFAALIVLNGCAAAVPPGSSLSAESSAAGVLPTVSVGPSPFASALPAPRASTTFVAVTPIPNAPDSNVVVKLVAAHVRWLPTTLAAPAGAVWHVQIDNQDGPPEHHNFVVASGKTFAERIYQSKNFDMGTFTFDVPALPAGTYFFICTVHPDVMTGELDLG